MLFRFIRRLIAPAVMSDADRLIANHDCGAAFLVRQILSTDRIRPAEAHWRRVLAEIERRDGYSPQRP